MLQIFKNSDNIITVTLTEKATVENPIYLFKFVNQTSNISYWFISNDISNFKQRYNQFLVIENENTTPIETIEGYISLGLQGLYDYEVYETTLINLDGLDSALDAIPFINKTVEVGLVDVVFANENTTEYEVEFNTNIVYQSE